MINVSYFFRLDPFIALQENGDAKALPLSHNVLHRGALLLQNSAKFAKLTRQGALAPEIIGKSNPTVLCSTQYKYLFASCRIPCPREDAYRLYFDPFSGISIPRHAIVACRGHFYAIPVLTKEGKVVSTQSLERLLSDCRKNARNQASGGVLSDLAYLTATDRDSWTEAYEYLVQIPRMAERLSLLQSGICILSIDDDLDDEHDAPNTYRSVSEAAQLLWHANKVHTSNRWWDKSINWVVSRDYCGLVGEHALVDGMPSLNMCRFTLDEAYNGGTADRADESASSTDDSDLKMTPIFHPTWDMLSENQKRRIECYVDVAKKQVTRHIDEYEIQVLEFKGYGLKRLRNSPGRPSADAWAQMAMQWASTLVFGTPVATYESTQTRRFLHGRTETTRSVSPASVAWVQSMMDGAEPSRQRELLQRALESHVQYTRQASAAQGVDRHFFGLALCKMEGETMPDLLKDPLFLRSKRWRMSTSTLGGTSPGFGPVVENGVGIGYDLVHNDVWLFTITARKEYNFVEPMRTKLEHCLNKMATFLEDGQSPASRL